MPLDHVPHLVGDDAGHLVGRLGFLEEFAEHDNSATRRGQRIATTLVRLNDGYDGGATVFPRLDLSWNGAMGEALTFRNVSGDGTGDERSLHSGEEVTRGMKLMASLWLRERA